MEIQDVSDLEMAFPADVEKLMPAWEEIPREFKYSFAVRGMNRWADIASDLFFHGLKGATFTPKPGIDTTKALRHIKAILGSFAPRHEHKEAAVAYLLSEWFESVEYEKAKP
jgi:hypothetical protein